MGNSVKEAGEESSTAAVAERDVRLLSAQELNVKLLAACERGDLVEIRACVESGADVRAATTTDGWSPLHVVASTGRIDAVRCLLDHGADVHTRRTNTGETALYSAAYNGHLDVVTCLLDRGADIDARRTDVGVTALYIAAQNGHLDVVMCLLDRGADIDARLETDGPTALCIAAQHGHLDVVMCLLDRGSDIHARRTDGSTALHSAAYDGHTDVIVCLLDRGADIDARTIHGSTALYLAAYNGHLDAVVCLLDRGADIHARTDDGSMALHIAASNGHLDVVRCLLDRGANANARVTDGGATALHLAAEYGRDNVAQYLLTHGADLASLDDTGGSAMFAAGTGGVVQVLIEYGGSWDQRNKDGMTPLAHAIQMSRYDTAKKLFEIGAPWDESCDRDYDNTSAESRSAAEGIRACLKHWMQLRQVDPSAELTDIPIENVNQGQSSVETYLREIAKTLTEDIVRRRKICVLGASCSGKTSLIKSVTLNVSSIVNECDRTIGIDLFAHNFESDANGNVRVKYETTIWDFAGQDVYQVAHSLYFSKRTLYLVFVDTEAYAKQLQQHLKDDMSLGRNESKLTRWVFHRVFRWVHLVLSRQLDAELVIVCSKTDRVGSVEVRAVVADLEQRLLEWKTHIIKEYEGSKKAAVQKTVTEFAEREQLCVSVTTQEAVEQALNDVRRLVVAKQERSYVMPRLFAQVLGVIHDLRAEVDENTSAKTRVEKLLVPESVLTETIMNKIDGLTHRDCLNILGTLHALGDILWFAQESQLKITGPSMIVLAPKLMLDLVREVVNHELQESNENSAEFDALRSRGELSHSLLCKFPLWGALSEQSKDLVVYFKQLMQQFNLAYPVGNGVVQWDSDLVVPSYWKSRKLAQDAVDAAKGHVQWRYKVPSFLSETIFDQLIVQSCSGGYKRVVTKTDVRIYSRGELLATIVYHAGPKGTEDWITIDLASPSSADCWVVLKSLVLAMEQVLLWFPGLGNVQRQLCIPKKAGAKPDAIDLKRFVDKTEHRITERAFDDVQARSHAKIVKLSTGREPEPEEKEV